MKHRSIVTLITAALLSALVSTSSAQQQQMPAGIEVITITAKRPVPALATACINEMMTQAPGATLHRQDTSGFSDYAPAADMTDHIRTRHALERCRTQDTARDGA